MPEVRKPYVGAIVYYKYRATDDVRAAMITKVHDDTWVGLRVFEPGGLDRSPSHVEFWHNECGWRWIPDQAPPEQKTFHGIYG